METGRVHAWQVLPRLDGPVAFIADVKTDDTRCLAIPATIDCAQTKPFIFDLLWKSLYIPAANIG
jgi:hypothetical protein